MQKVQVTLTPQEVAALAMNPLGYDVAKYLKFLAGQAAYALRGEIPTVRISENLEKKLLKGLEDHKKGKSRLFYETK